MALKEIVKSPRVMSVELSSINEGEIHAVEDYID